MIRIRIFLRPLPYNLLKIIEGLISTPECTKDKVFYIFAIFVSFTVVLIPCIYVMGEDIFRLRALSIGIRLLN